MGIITNILRKEINRALINPDKNLLSNVLYSMINDQVVWPEKNKEQYVKNYQNNIDVFSVVRKVTDAVKTVPVVIKQGTGEDMVVIDTPKGADQENLFKLIHRPNPSQAWPEFIETGITFKIITGNGFIYAPRMSDGLNKGQTLEMWNMPSQYTVIKSGGIRQPVESYQIVLGATKEKPFPVEDVLHWKDVNLNYGGGQELYGM